MDQSLSKSFILVQISEKYFLMDSFINRGYRSHFLNQITATFKIKSRVLVCSTPYLCIVKNDHVHQCGKVRRSIATPTIFFSVKSYDLKSLSFKFGNDIFNTFEILRSSFTMIFQKITFCCYFVHL